MIEWRNRAKSGWQEPSYPLTVVVIFLWVVSFCEHRLPPIDMASTGRRWDGVSVISRWNRWKHRGIHHEKRAVNTKHMEHTVARRGHVAYHGPFLRCTYLRLAPARADSWVLQPIIFELCGERRRFVLRHTSVAAETRVCSCRRAPAVGRSQQQPRAEEWLAIMA